MSESATPVGKAARDVEKAEAVLGGIEQVLQVVEKAETSTRGRTLVRIAAVMIAGGVALFGVAVLLSRRQD
jgi:hypothetical protein